MPIELKPGLKLFSAVCSTQTIVVRASSGEVDLRCGGEPVVTTAAEAAAGGAPVAGFDGGTLLGKRYVDADGSFELLCTKAGSGSLSVGDSVLQLSGAKPLPASD
jgi:hypothetical protein